MAGKPKKIAVGLSGGVDSSVAAALLQQEGHAVIGIQMEIFDGDADINGSAGNACYGPDEKEDREVAQRICKKLGIPFYTVDLKAEYRRHVIEYFREEYLAGRTPNPCVVCNRQLKFGFLLQKAEAAGIDFEQFATGHYARITRRKGRWLLQRGVDQAKDQSYFLYRLTPSQLARTRFPLGGYTKKDVRDLARNLGLETAHRPESQDFVAGGNYAGFFKADEIHAGDIVDECGNVLGKHRGIIHYTVGQRKGLGVSSDRPLYVSRIDGEKNRIILSPKERLYAEGLIIKDLNLIAVQTLDRPCKVSVKIRAGGKNADGTVFPHGKAEARVMFTEPQMAIAPGQSAVLYQDDIVLGGGVIKTAL